MTGHGLTGLAGHHYELIIPLFCFSVGVTLVILSIGGYDKGEARKVFFSFVGGVAWILAAIQFSWYFLKP